MAKKREIVKEEVNEPIIDKVIYEPLDEKKSYDVVLLPISKMVRVETEKKVSGNIANILIKKGFAKLKN